MPALKIDGRDLELLERGQWQTPENDRRSSKLARLALCRSTRLDPATKTVTWVTSAKGRLLLRSRQIT